MYVHVSWSTDVTKDARLGALDRFVTGDALTPQVPSGICPKSDSLPG